MPRQIVRNFGTCMSFNGSTGKVDIGHNSSLSITDNITITAWIKPKSYGQSSLGIIVGKGNDPGFGSGGYQLSMRNNSGQKTIRFGANNTTYEASAGIITLGVWQHVAVTYDKNAGSNQVKFYLNGVAAGVATKSNSMTTNTESLFIGNRNDLDRTFDGLIDEVKIFNTTLSASDIEDEYNGVYGDINGLKGYWKFDEGSGSTTQDISGNQSAGNITTATFSSDVFMIPRTGVS